MREIFHTPTVRVRVDTDRRILEVAWNGLIGSSDLEEALTVIKENLFEKTNMIVNRTDLLDFDSDAKRWILHVLMRKESKNLVPYFSKLATVEAKTRVRLFASVINQLGSFIFPRLSMSSFDHIDKAIDWIVEKDGANIDDKKSKSSFLKKIFQSLFV